jgi:endogenous inhibitor of DNA gyrase (YacG/DUF329 family)
MHDITPIQVTCMVCGTKHTNETYERAYICSDRCYSLLMDELEVTTSEPQIDKK